MTIDEYIEVLRLGEDTLDNENLLQIVEWLEELKALREKDQQLIHLTQKEFEVGTQNPYNKALDDFIIKATCEQYNIYNWDDDEYENGMVQGYQYSIEIAKQLKVGGKNDGQSNNEEMV